MVIAFWLPLIKSEAMRRVSSADSARGPVGARRPLTSISGGRPGEKNKSLIFGALRSMASSSAGVVTAGGVWAGATAAPPDATAVPPSFCKDIKGMVNVKKLSANHKRRAGDDFSLLVRIRKGATDNGTADVAIEGFFAPCFELQ